MTKPPTDDNSEFAETIHFVNKNFVWLVIGVLLLVIVMLTLKLQHTASLYNNLVNLTSNCLEVIR